MILENPQSVPTTDPMDLIRLRDSVYAPDLLFAAVGPLDLFTRLSGRPADLGALCRGLDIQARPADVMLTYFKALGLVREERGMYSVTPLAREHLTADSNWSLVPYLATQAERPSVGMMLEVLRTGRPASWGGQRDEAEWARAMERPDFAEMFTSGMESRGAYFAPSLARSFDFSQYRSLIDIAGAAGVYAACIQDRHPGLKTALLEKSPVDKAARWALERRGLAGKVDVISSDMFREIPRGFDIHLFSHVWHDWGTEENRRLAMLSYDALNPGGIIMIHDAHLDAGKDGPLSVAEYSVLLMFSTEGRCYSTREIGDILEAEGFRDIRCRATAGNRSAVTGRKAPT